MRNSKRLGRLAVGFEFCPTFQLTLQLKHAPFAEATLLYVLLLTQGFYSEIDYVTVSIRSCDRIRFYEHFEPTSLLPGMYFYVAFDACHRINHYV